MKKFIFGLLIFLFAGNLFSQSGWQWMNPLPTRNGLNDIYFIDSHKGFAVGTGGTILVTTNGGANWTDKNYKISLSLNSVIFINQNTGFITGNEYDIGAYRGAYILRTSDGGNNWTEVYNNLTTALLMKKIYFVNSNTGFAITGDSYTGLYTNNIGSYLLKTTNGGFNWVQVSIPFDIAMNGISFFGNTGIIVGKWGKIIKSTDNGINWSNVSYGTSTLNDVCIKSFDTVYVTGDYGALLKSTNAGQNWTTINSFASKNLGSIIFTNSNTGYIAGSNIFKSTDAGVTWDSICTDYRATKVIVKDNIEFFSLAKVIIGGSSSDDVNQIFKSSDAGAHWTNIRSTITDNHLNSMCFINENTGYIVGANGIMLKTTDKWNWNVVNSFTSNTLSCIDFFNGSTGVSMGSGGSYRTTDGGASWVTVSSGSNSQYGSLSILDMNTAFCALNSWILPGSGGGNLLKTTNRGENWSSCYSGGWVNSLSLINSNTGWISLPNAVIAKTTNSGVNWINVFTGDFYSYVTQVFFKNESTGFMTYERSNQDGIYKTTNGGYNWVMVIPGYAQGTFKFFNELTGYLCTRNSTATYAGSNFFVTTDGGNQWKPSSNSSYMSLVSSSALTDFHFFDMNTGIAIGSYGVMLKTINSGGITIGVSQTSSEIPENYLLKQNYPNPFNPSTVIRYQLSVAGFTTLKVFDLLGKEVAMLVNEKQNAGSYAVDFHSTEFNLPSGIYFYTLNAGVFKETMKMVLVK